MIDYRKLNAIYDRRNAGRYSKQACDDLEYYEECFMTLSNFMNIIDMRCQGYQENVAADIAHIIAVLRNDEQPEDWLKEALERAPANELDRQMARYINQAPLRIMCDTLFQLIHKALGSLRPKKTLKEGLKVLEATYKLVNGHG